MEQLDQEYFGLLSFEPAVIPCLAIEEIVAEKIRAASQRSKIRDLHDLAEICADIRVQPCVAQDFLRDHGVAATRREYQSALWMRSGAVLPVASGRLAQLVRAPALQAGSRGFESLTAHHASPRMTWRQAVFS